MGAKAYTRIEQVGAINGVVLEIGSDRGEGSTVFLARFCLRNNLDFYSIDFEKSAYERAKEIKGVKAYNTTGENFLETIFPTINRKISFAYLDGFDYIYPGMKESLIKHQSSLYGKYGFELTNYNSMLSHLYQVESIVKFASNRCYILIDDTWSVGILYNGKGGFAVPFLLKNGFSVIECGTEKDMFNSYVFLGRL